MYLGTSSRCEIAARAGEATARLECACPVTESDNLDGGLTDARSRDRSRHGMRLSIAQDHLSSCARREPATAEPRFVSGFRSSIRSWSHLCQPPFTLSTTTPHSGLRPAGCCRRAATPSHCMSSGEALLAQLPKDAGSSCILLDIRIPELSGPELQARLNDMGSRLPIVFLTGHGDISTAVQVIRAGAEDLLTKPVAKDDAAGRDRAGHRARAREAGGRRQARGVATARERPQSSGAPGFRTCGTRGTEQADRLRARNHGTDHQGASAQSHGEAWGRLVGRACAYRRAPRHAGSACKFK